jgi:hypothetical protein
MSHFVWMTRVCLIKDSCFEQARQKRTPADLRKVSPGNCWRRFSTVTPFGGLVLRTPLPWKTAFEVGRVVRAREREYWLSVGCSSVGCSRGVRVS